MKVQRYRARPAPSMDVGILRIGKADLPGCDGGRSGDEEH